MSGWLMPDGTPMRFQDGDHVRIDTTGVGRTSLPFVTGYVRGYDAVTTDGITRVGYTLYNLGNPELHGVKEEKLTPSLPPFGEPCGKGHGIVSCHLCGANL